MGRTKIGLDRPRRWNPPIPAGILPAYDEALRVIRVDARRVNKEAIKLRREVTRAHWRLSGGVELEAEEKRAKEAELEKMRAKLEILEVQSEVNLPDVRWSVANGMADLSIPSHRHLVEQRWRKDGELDLLMERIHQMDVVPDVLPVLHPTVDLHVTARLMPEHFDSLMRRNTFQRRVNTFKEVIPGNYLTPKQTRVPPKLYANVFHTDVRLYTMLMVDPDVPDEENQTFSTFLHWLKPNIPLSATHAGRIPLLNTHTPYIPPHPQQGTPYHRYVVLLLPQPPLVPLKQRYGFDVRAFAKQWGLNGAVGGGVHMWREVWDEYVGAVYRYDLHKAQPVYGRPPRFDPQRTTHEAPTRQKYRAYA
ncbi:phosphatidylethanolamine-binding protein [Mycena vulgaris]|nr:phosphatidylethanolamine-binding protein [Mycena vulgaris]